MSLNSANLIQAARAADASGQIEQAISLCGQVLSRDSSNVNALLLLGSIAIRQGGTSQAEAFLRQAYANDPYSYDAVRWLTTLLIGRDGGAEAVQFGESAIRIRPSEAEAYVILGLAQTGADQSQEAIESFRRAIEMNPQMSGAYHNLAVALQREEFHEEAIRSFQQAIELSPDVAETYLHLGRAYLSTNRGEEALSCAQKALKLQPKSSAARRLHSDASFMAVHGENGDAHIAHAIARNPSSGFPHALRSSRLQEQGKFAEAEVSILHSIELEPKQGLAYYLFSHNRKITEQDRPMIETMESLCTQSGLQSQEVRYLHFAIGKAYDDLGDFRRAIQHFDLANSGLERSGSDRKVQGHDGHAARVRRFIELFTHEFLWSGDGVALEEDEPIFIFGMPRSGTTLLEQILSRHSTVGAGGEQPFWRDHARRVVDLDQSKLKTEALRNAGILYRDLMNSIAPRMGHVTDKFPSNYVYLGILHILYPNAKFIHAKRHPVDTCLSIYMRPFSSAQDHGQSREQIVNTYRLYEESIAHWREVLPPGRFLDVDYEALVTNPETVTRALIAHCRLDWEDACLNPELGDRRVVTFSKWQVRQPVYTTSVERWRKYEPWLGAFQQLMPE